MKDQQENNEPDNNNNNKPRFYKLNAALLPDHLFRKEADVSDWIGGNEGSSGLDQNTKQPWMESTDDPRGFRPGSLHKVVPIDPFVDFERCIGIALYMIANVSPVVVPLAAAAWILLGIRWAKHLAIFVTAYHGGLYAIWRIGCVPFFKNGLDYEDIAKSQHFFESHNIMKYCSVSYVWPDTLHRPALTTNRGTANESKEESEDENENDDRPIIFCVIPHGLAPLGIAGYPFFSKVWNSRLCSWTTVPFVLNLPITGTNMRSLGYIPAKSRPILEALTKQNRNVGVVLDGIDGMFRTKDSDHEVAATVLDRKGICKIALGANATIVPVYGFGHTEFYDVVVDPFGILEFLSANLGVSLTPFFGRWGWFLGPPKREVPLAMCLGDPIFPPSISGGNGDVSNNSNSNIGSITQDQIDNHHAKLLDGFTKVFETHKRAYYGEDMGAKKKLVFVNSNSSNSKPVSKRGKSINGREYAAAMRTKGTSSQTFVTSRYKI